MMMNKTNLFWNVKTALCAVMMSAAVLVGCDKDDAPANTPQDTLIDKVELPSATEPFVAGTAITIKGEGFTSEDKIIFRATTTRATEIEAEIVEVTATSITFKVPTGLTAGENSLVLKRGEVEQVLGSIRIDNSNTTFDNILEELKSYAGKHEDELHAIMAAKGYELDMEPRDYLIFWRIDEDRNEKVEYIFGILACQRLVEDAMYQLSAISEEDIESKKDALLKQFEAWGDLCTRVMPFENYSGDITYSLDQNQWEHLTNLSPRTKFKEEYAKHKPNILNAVMVDGLRELYKEKIGDVEEVSGCFYASTGDVRVHIWYSMWDSAWDDYEGRED
ncbi:MAG: IPT/TIG domain-containing protein [Bacteroidales bacterium]